MTEFHGTPCKGELHPQLRARPAPSPATPPDHLST
jgi:hypothetical protein